MPVKKPASSADILIATVTLSCSTLNIWAAFAPAIKPLTTPEASAANAAPTPVAANAKLAALPPAIVKAPDVIPAVVPKSVKPLVRLGIQLTVLVNTFPNLL